MDIVVEFQGRKSPGVECNGVQFTIRSHDGKDSGKCVVRGVSLDCDLSVQDPMGKDWRWVKVFLSASKAEWHSSEKCQGVTLVGKMHKQNCDFGISVNETTVENWQAEEGLNILDFCGVGHLG